jgi:hypothetical protein
MIIEPSMMLDPALTDYSYGFTSNILNNHDFGDTLSGGRNT